MYSLKLAFRNIRRNGIYSIINIIGLAVSLTVCIMIMLWVEDEMSYDGFHVKKKNIYQTIASMNMSGEDLYWKASSFPLGPRSKEEIPGIENFCRVARGNDLKFHYEEKESPLLPLTFVDTSFFSMFSFKIVAGNLEQPFVDKNSIVISQTVATALFGDDDPVGKIITHESIGGFHVTAVMEDMPKNTDFMTDFVCSIDVLYDLSGGKQAVDQKWGSLGILTFLLLYPDVDPKAVEKEITELNNANLRYRHSMNYSLQPLVQNHFYNEKGEPNSNLQTSRLFSVASVMLLLIACINYVNLVTARVSKRNREIFIRNVIGAKKGNLFLHSISESLLLFLIAIIVATIILYAAFPLFNDISGKNISFSFFNAKTLWIYLMTLLFVAVFAGIFPAFNLALHKPSDALGKSVGKKAGGVFIRQSLVIVQFVAAVILIMGSITITRQMQYVRNKDLGYNKEHLLTISLRGNMPQHADAVKSELFQQTGVLGATFSSQNILWSGMASGWSSSEDPDKNLMLFCISTDKDFIPTMGMELIAGENFTNSPADSAHFILNETAVRTIGFDDPVGQPFIFQPFPGHPVHENGKIIGVVKDFHFKDLHVPIEPMVLCYYGDPQEAYIRVAPHAAQQVVSEIEKLWEKYNSKSTFHYRFLDEGFDDFYRSDMRVNKLFKIFAVIAIFISCLGLFGLVTFTAETKHKEIGIRKVLGASVGDIVAMLSKEFLILVGIAMLIAFPLSYYLLNEMLNDYA
ncbi:MAG: ABC transporter permease, partial [Bacteroidales bacterium]|nr:ABC transporter permease [Bacteroidales bacterium]